ncbi:hypothetical protein DCC62_18135 [candidate division KSB1 bacterium]|nr:MAG: hypothetical protein DCC62_18135 [candidate division KSB1 bacterium]
MCCDKKGVAIVSVEYYYGNTIYITDERWDHIYEEHPDMIGYDEHVRQTIRDGKRTQDEFDPRKYFYTKPFRNLFDINNHVVVVVKFGQRFSEEGHETQNNFVMTAYQNHF